MEGVGKTYGNHVVFRNANLTVERGDKVAFVGKNGEGKSTLVKCIMGEIADFTGKLQLGHNVKIGYFAQNQAQLLNENLTVFDTIDYVAQGDIRLKIRDILGAFMFGGEASDKKVKVLSGGERTRLAMIRLLLEPVNLLILDEPTNDLDIPTLTILEDYLDSFLGIVITVSHDRYFLDNIADRIFAFEAGGKLVQYEGGYTDYLEAKERKNGTVVRESEESAKKKADRKNWKKDAPEKLKFTYKEQKEYETIDDEIASLEQKIEEFDEQMIQYATNSAKLSEITEQKEAAEATLEEKMERWVYLNDLAERIENQKSLALL